MKNFKVYLNDFFPKLQKNGCNAYFEAFIPVDLKEENNKRPSLVICPGGGYGHVSERESEVVGNHFLPLGYNVFILKYSVAPFAVFPQQLCELAGLIKLIHKNCDEWNCDVNRIALMGFSAGGHLAAHYCNAYNWSQVCSIMQETYSVSACILSYPVITAGEFSHKGSFINLLGHELSDAEIEKFSCENMVSENTPPTFIWHTAADSAVPVQNSLLYANKLSKYNVPFEMHIYPFGNHGLSTADLATNPEIPKEIERVHEWLCNAKSWLKDTFNK